jgi:pimeloyl-ACP methyl ester carboxylesterase
MFGSVDAVSDPNDVTAQDYATDINSWVRIIRQLRSDSACIWVLGHSEGGLMALLAGQDPNTQTCGLILVASAGRPIGDVLRDQLEPQLAGTALLDQAMSAIEALEAGRHVDASDIDPALQPLLNPSVQDFLISTLALDPAELIGGISQPVLILQGECDLQISVEDAKRLKSAAPASTMVLLPRTNHVLKEVPPADRAANIATYGDPDLPLAPGVIEAIADFVFSTNLED